MNVPGILLGIAYVAESLVWIYSMCLRFKRRYRTWYPYIGYIIIDVSITVLKEFTKISEITGGMFFTLLTLVYALTMIQVLFEGKSLDKVLHIAMLLLMSLCGDTISLILFLLGNYNLQDISQAGLVNSLATVLSKAILLTIVKIIFGREGEKIDYEMLPAVLATLVMEFPTIVLFNQMSLINNNDWFLMTFVLSQIGLLVLVLYMRKIFQSKKQKEEELLKWKRDMEMQLRGSEGAEETLQNLRMLKHDMKQHIGVIKYMLDEERYDTAREYLDRVYKDVDIASDYYTLKNRSVSITLTSLKQFAKLKSVNFYTKIMTEEYHIGDVEMCTILSNIGRNAIEAAEGTDDKYCKLVITEQGDGCRITCENSYKGELRWGKTGYRSTKGEDHGYGIKIVRKIVSQKYGKSSFRGENGIFSVDIYIPGGDK